MEKRIARFEFGFSGLARVIFDDGTSLFVESGYGLRQFESAFGSLQAAVGQTIRYEADGWIMTSFEPIGRE